MSINIMKGQAADGGFILAGNIHVTQRELEALAAIAEGHDNENAANKLGISYTTIRNHTYNVMKKLGAKNRTEALVKAVENGMVVISLKRELAKKSADDYLICKYCGRSFTWDELVEVHEEPFVVNHVLLEPPDWLKCPYEKCNAHATDAYTWEQVRNFHPEYPEMPEKGVNYSTDELLEAELKVYEDAMREMKGKAEEKFVNLVDEKIEE